MTAELPRRLNSVVKDITSNLRDALDHAVYGSALSLGMADPKRTGFPFGNDATHLKGELTTWKFKDVPAEIHPLLTSFKPYPAGNDLLVNLNRIRNPNTHRVLVPVGIAALDPSTTISGGVITGGTIGYSRWHPTTNEVEFMRLNRGSQFNYNVTITFDVTFGDVEIVRDKPVIGTLREIATEVERVVLAIEADTGRILASRP